MKRQPLEIKRDLEIDLNHSKKSPSHSYLTRRNSKSLNIEEDKVNQARDTDVQESHSISQILCTKCHKGDQEESLLLCDECNQGFHTFCLNPPISIIPKNSWYCLECSKHQEHSGRQESSSQEELIEIYHFLKQKALFHFLFSLVLLGLQTRLSFLQYLC